jgi:hypothetical protein
MDAVGYELLRKACVDGRLTRDTTRAYLVETT